MVSTTDKTNMDLLQELAAVGEAMREAAKQFDADSEAAWNALDKDQQLMLFCAVVRRIYQGEIKERQSYRGVLYDVFEFGPDSYAPAQYAGYLTIHNMLYEAVDLENQRGYPPLADNASY
jgi:hypothetical protein